MQNKFESGDIVVAQVEGYYGIPFLSEGDICQVLTYSHA